MECQWIFIPVRAFLPYCCHFKSFSLKYSRSSAPTFSAMNSEINIPCQTLCRCQPGHHSLTPWWTVMALQWNSSNFDIYATQKQTWTTVCPSDLPSLCMWYVHRHNDHIHTCAVFVMSLAGHYSLSVQNWISGPGSLHDSRSTSRECRSTPYLAAFQCFACWGCMVKWSLSCYRVAVYGLAMYAYSLTVRLCVLMLTRTLLRKVIFLFIYKWNVNSMHGMVARPCM